MFFNANVRASRTFDIRFAVLESLVVLKPNCSSCFCDCRIRTRVYFKSTLLGSSHQSWLLEFKYSRNSSRDRPKNGRPHFRSCCSHRAAIEAKPSTPEPRASLIRNVSATSVWLCRKQRMSQLWPQFANKEYLTSRARACRFGPGTRSTAFNMLCSTPIVEHNWPTHSASIAASVRNPWSTVTAFKFSFGKNFRKAKSNATESEPPDTATPTTQFSLMPQKKLDMV